MSCLAIVIKTHNQSINLTGNSRIFKRWTIPRLAGYFTVSKVKVKNFLIINRSHVLEGTIMKPLFTIILLVINISSDLAIAQDLVPEPILPNTFRWGSPPNMPGVQGAWVVGAEQNLGLYIFRVKLESGATIPPHTHPDERNTTVLTGTVYAGFGDNFDETQVVAIPAGAVYVAPANVPHYIWAKDGEAVYQEAGMGPTKTSFIVK
jgi:quercetin dioxygenase-like cupin family protein